MKITALNKIVSMFLVGGVVLLLLAITEWRCIAVFVSGNAGALGEVNGLLAISVPLITAFMLVASAFLGAVFEGLTELTVRRFLRTAARSAKLMTGFGQRRAYEAREYWGNKLATEMRTEAAQYRFGIIKKEHLSAFSDTLLFQTNKEHYVEWMVGHYSTFIFASNLTLVVLLFLGRIAALAVGGQLTVWTTLLVSGGGVVFVYSLCSLALGTYTHSYEVAYRSAYLAGKSEKVHGASGEAGKTGVEKSSVPPD